MELLEETLKKIWPGLPNANWISVDTETHKIGPKILESRFTERGIDDKPIILYGFRSFESLVRSEKKYPRLLVSPGVHYLHLPISWKRLENILNQAKKQEFDKEELKTELMDSAFAGKTFARMESVLAHNIGNFLGPEKLLYGSHLAGMINADDFVGILDEIRNSQFKALGNTQEYRLYRLSQSNYKPQKNIRQSAQTIKGHILYIDDHAYLGWASSVASALWGKCYRKQHHTAMANIDTFFDNRGILRLSVINREGVSSGENGFVERAFEIAGDDRMLGLFDLVLLDLRLRWKEDERIGNQVIDELSGVRLLRKIRETNAAIPVVVLTASRRAKNMEKVLNLGADAYFIKEAPHLNEEKDDITDYHHRLVQIVEETMKKSYLSEAWKLVQRLRRTSISEFLRNNIDYEALPEELKVDWENDVILFLNKAIALIKGRNSQFEKERMGLDLTKEAIINLSMPADTIYRKNQAYREVTQKKDRLYYYSRPNFGGDLLLSDLRAFSAHGVQEKIDDDDAKISIYLALRLFIPSADMEVFSRRLFGLAPARKELLSPNFFREIGSALLMKLGLSEEKYECEIDGHKIIRKDDSVEVIYPNNKRFEGTIICLPHCLIYPKMDSPIFKKLKFNKENYYLLFLCRLSSRPHSIRNSDYRLIAKISEKCGSSVFDAGYERAL